MRELNPPPHPPALAEGLHRGDSCYYVACKHTDTSCCLDSLLNKEKHGHLNRGLVQLQPMTEATRQSSDTPNPHPPTPQHISQACPPPHTPLPAIQLQLHQGLGLLRITLQTPHDAGQHAAEQTVPSTSGPPQQSPSLLPQQTRFQSTISQRSSALTRSPPFLTRADG